MAQVTASSIHDLLAGSSTGSTGNNTNADYVINLNLPPWSSQNQVAQQTTSTNAQNNRQLYIMGSVLLLLIVGIIVLKRRK